MRLNKKTRKNRFWLWASFLFLLIAIPLTLTAVYNVQTYGNIAGVRPTCVSHNDCPNDWGFCVSGECYSYIRCDGRECYDSKPGTDPVGRDCNNNADCNVFFLSCVSGKCQRVVGEVGGCSISQDCVDQYSDNDPGAWSCTNNQCIKFGGRQTQYMGADGVMHEYGSYAACLNGSDCGPGTTCNESGGCVYLTNSSACHQDGECGLLPKDPNKKYVCLDASGQPIDFYHGDGSATGTCVLKDTCDPGLLGIDGEPIKCGPGQHCESITSGAGNNDSLQAGDNRRARCMPDAGTTSVGGQPPKGWNDPCPGGGQIIERCSTASSAQRVRYCSNDPNYATNAIRWNGWTGPNEESCVTGGEVWRGPAAGGGTPLRDNVPAGFYDTSGCALGTRIVRCSNTYSGQLVSYCSEENANPVNAVRVDNWVGSNGETCSTQGEIVPSTPTGTPAVVNTPSAPAADVNTGGIIRVIRTLINR